MLFVKTRATLHLTRLLVLLALVVLLTSVLGVVAFAAEPQTGAEKECYINGDVNADGIFDDQDAIYALYSYLFGEEEYPIRQQWNYTGSAAGTGRDVIFMLDALGNRYDPAYSGMGAEKHDYFDPVWTWTENGSEVTATLTLSCACGQQKVLTVDDGIVVSQGQTVPASCLSTGSQAYSAWIVFDGEEYTSAYTVTLPALGHQAGTELYPDANGHHNVCINDNCGVEMNAASHNWYVEQQADEANFVCGQMVVQQYVCDCGATKTENLHIKEHDYQAIPGVADVLVDANTCQYAKEQLQCTKCNDIINAGLYNKHTYVASQVDATCQQPGTKTYTCSGCHHSYSETIPVDSTKHTWDNGVEANGIITYTCGGCGETKTAVAASGNSATVNKDQLASADELKMDNATLEMDQNIKDNLDQDKEIEISVDSKDLAEVEGNLSQPLTQEQKDKIGDGQIYDFNMLYVLNAGTTEKVEFQGWITVTLPYDLQPGDDVDSICVWYIADDGTLDHYEATYSNGFVTFKTNHFSYYSVTRLTPAQRCEIYGHNWKEYSEEATCTKAGYVKQVCQRCAAVNGEGTVIPATGHSYGEPVVTPATCMNSGYSVRTCGCGHAVTEVIPALGHDMALSDTVAATCGAAGKEVYSCSRTDCQHRIEKPIAQLIHNYQYTSTTAATCTAGGYEVHTCAYCQGTVRKNETAPLGHNYSADQAEWKWSEDYSSVTVVLTCGNSCGSTKDVKAAVTIKGASCTEGGSAKAELLYNNKIYTKELSTGEALGHNPGANWTTGANRHYLLCQVCNEKLENSLHEFGEGVTTKEPTCIAPGTTTYTCATCGYEKTETIPATEEHNYVDNVCTGCGAEVKECEHKPTNPSKIDLSGYKICEGNEFCWYTCECGEVKYLELNQTGCKFEEDSRPETDENGQEYKVRIMTCALCGLKLESAEFAVYSTEPCCARYSVWAKVSLGDTVIAEFTYSSEDMVEYHPTTKVVSEVELSHLGICGEVLTTYECPCGEHTYTRRSTSCEFVYTDKEESYCQKCGVVRTMDTKFVDEEGTCQLVEINTYTYYMNKEPVYSYSNSYTYDRHDYEITDYMLYGSICTDGIRIVQTCKTCGHVSETFSYDHELVQQTVMELTDYNSCYDRILINTCLCEEGYSYVQLISDEGKECQWVPHFCNPETKEETWLCTNCGSTRADTVTYGDKDEHCQMEVLWAYTYTDGKGREMVTSYQRGWTSQHDMTTSRELLGDSCKDGVQISQTCNDCGDHDEYIEYYHMEDLVREQDMAELGLCGGVAEIHSCPCGEEYWVNWDDQCKWEWIESTENGYVRRCSNCGTVHTWSSEEVEQISVCQTRIITTDVYTRGIKEVFRISRDGMQWHHDIVTEATLVDGAKSCEEGIHIKEYCKNCDLNSEWTATGKHITYPTGEEILCEGKLCGTLVRETSSCPCGEITETNQYWRDGECKWEWVYSEEHKMWVDRCTNCGVIKHQTRTEKPIEGETCKIQIQWLYTYELNGEVLFTETNTGIGMHHNMVASFNMLGKTCAEGYTVSNICSGCGLTETYEDVYYECNTYVKERTLIVSADKGICGNIYLYFNSCPCGKETNYHTSVDCQFEYLGYDNETQTVNARCVSCGLVRMVSNTTEPIPGTCLAENINTHVYMLGDETVGTASFSNKTPSHQYEDSFSMLGDSCEDGYYITQVCKKCNDRQTDDYLYTEHTTRRLAWYQLQDYGMCGGEISKYGCPCGKNARWQQGIDCNWQSTGNRDPETGLMEWYCADCNTSIYMATQSTHDQPNCRENCVFILKLVRDGEVLLNVTDSYSRERHTEIATDFELTVEGGDCESGYTVYIKCQYCDYTQTRTGEGHGCFTTELITIDSACGSYIRKYRCACGYTNDADQFVYCQNWENRAYEETDENGRIHRIEDKCCTTCGMIQREEWYDAFPENSCSGTRYITNSLWLDGRLLTESSRTAEIIEHVYGDPTYQLMEGAKSCSDGVLETVKCKYCEHSMTNHLYSHKRIAQESIDLQPYGAVCGAKLVLSKCTCGAEYGYEFSEDTCCDLDKKDIQHWMENILSDNQYGTEGWTDTWSYSYTYICAVTDPQCQLSIRMSRYWLLEDCVATQYETWQLGYDAQTGTCAKEITIATGKVRSYHNYECSGNTEEREGGGWIHTSNYVCPDCGSTMTEISTNDANGNSLYWERHVYNKLDNGENLEAHLYNDYSNVYKGHNMFREYGGSEIAADGTEYWYKRVYTYNFPESCKYTETYSDSTGHTWTREYDHYAVTKMQVVKQPTCSQPGERVDREFCVNCEQVNSDWEYHYEIMPTGHNFVWSDELQTFACGDCGLKNANGATGGIILEDLTAAYGKDTDYVIGYYNQNGGEFVLYAGVVLEEVTEGNDELILEGIEFINWTVEQNTINAIVVNKAAVAEAAAAAMESAGYTGSYAIRITFVPANGDGTLDYAITFDSQKA